MRILIANTPLMYREVLALAIHRHNPDFEVMIADPKGLVHGPGGLVGHNPDFEVMIADPESLDGEAGRFGSQALVRNDDGVEIGVPDGVVCWVGISTVDDRLDALIRVDGTVSKIHDVRLEDVLAALDEADKFLSEHGG
jgi:hypothetical protein